MFTLEEIMKLLPLAVDAFGEGDALVQKLRGLSGKTDAELLADASSVDQAVEKQAAADSAAS